MITLFRPAMQFRGPYSYRTNSGQFAGLGEGNVVSDILNSITSGASNLIDTVTGAKAAREAQLRALELAKTQAEAQIATTQSRAAEFAAIAPWVGLAAVAVVLVVAVTRKKG